MYKNKASDSIGFQAEGHKGRAQFADNRTSNHTHLKLQNLMGNSPQLTTQLAQQTIMSSSHVLQKKIIQREDDDSPPTDSSTNVAQMAIGKNKRKTKKSKSSAKQTYGGCLFNAAPLTVKNAVFFDRPPSNSRSGQGDHVVSYSLITQTVATSVNGKALDTAGAALAELLGAAKEFVATGAINNWWHTAADNLIVMLNGIDPTADEDTAKRALNKGVNDILFLLNTMPGTAMKNKKSTKGHGEGGSKGGLYYAEQQVKAGKAMKGNVWVNVLNLFDGAADKSLMQNPTKLDAKLAWLMALFSRAAPTIYDLIESDDLTLLPDADMSDALHNKFSPLDAISIGATLQAWIDA